MRRKQQRPGISSNNNTTQCSADLTKPNHEVLFGCLRGFPSGSSPWFDVPISFQLLDMAIVFVYTYIYLQTNKLTIPVIVSLHLFAVMVLCTVT